MDKIRYRDMQRWVWEDMKEVLPIAVTHDSQPVMVLVTTEQWNKLTENYRSRHDSQASGATSLGNTRTSKNPDDEIPWYVPGKSKVGEMVKVPKGKSYIVMEVPAQDADGYRMYEE